MEKIIPFPDFNNNYNAIKIVDFLDEFQQELNLENASVYYKYPMFKEYDQEPQYPDLFIVSPYHGIIILNICKLNKRSLNTSKFNDELDALDEIYGQILSKFIKIPSLKKRRSRSEINVPVNTLLFIENTNSESFSSEDSYVFDNNQKLKEIFNVLSKGGEKINLDSLTDIYSVIDGTRAIPKVMKRDLGEEDADKKGGVLAKLETQIATFDQKQRIAALTIVNGPQRIRGMAGSGKTVVLAMKAALMHLENPSAKILFTFYTKSLYDQIKQMITRFYRMQQDHDPNWDNIHILHAWGGKNLPGVYYNTCMDNDISPLTFSIAQQESRKVNMNNFEYVCDDLLQKTHGEIDSKYDFVLMDEGQDFPETFYWICRKLAKKDHIVWAYDELQNILDIEVQETKKLFENRFGDSGIDLPKLMEKHPYQNNDIVLHTSYRNPLETLIIAQALGFGIYNDKMLQMLENKDHWEDLGYVVKQGTFVEGAKTVIERPRQNSPSIISDIYSKDEIVEMKLFDSWDDEIKFISKEIKDAIDEKLLPEDIMVLCIDDRHAKRYFEKLSQELAKVDIFTNNTLTSYSGEIFTVNGKITLTTVYRGKGNEAAMVFVIGVDSLLYGQYDIVSRNKLFTAFTRSKAWLKVTGINEKGFFISHEIDQAKQKIPNLDFNYPNVNEIRTLRRQLAKENAALNSKREELLNQLDKMGLDQEAAMKLLRGELKS
ncbi:ATP-binding domain-containing protein [Carnobacterium divergens]|uniref:ATP-binding domain-containing protein n=1 Tax=Carnobacterium divergens TaxID=2748 RepID=A0AAW8R9C2_CARDV|nr:ATP-binding domain-containing protein [Carnobacterium divergens]MDT1956943.1 ATP-binding domain-containing protein [Carnobacterium divergens]MDT1972913.1 ATP-binding domain-containing protein [Carnobacterium divergens]